MRERVSRNVGLATAVAGVAVDQAFKLWMLGPYAIEQKGRVAVSPVLDLVLVWNRGVSYGLFTQNGDLGRWLLVLFGVAGALLFGWWMWRTRRLLSALSLGLVAGGALSNVIDRLFYGAVADFFLFHVGRFEWYVFNLADVWIVAGVIGLLLAWASERPEIATEA
jgi:signal peptidase II